MADGFNIQDSTPPSINDVLDAMTAAVRDRRFDDTRFNCAKDTLAGLGKAYGMCANDVAVIGGELSVSAPDLVGRYGKMKYGVVAMHTMEAAGRIEELFGDIAQRCLSIAILVSEDQRAPLFIALQDACGLARVAAFQDLLLISTILRGISTDYPDVTTLRQVYFEKATHIVDFAEQLFPIEALVTADSNRLWTHNALFAGKKDHVNGAS